MSRDRAWACREICMNICQVNWPLPDEMASSGRPSISEMNDATVERPHCRIQELGSDVCEKHQNMFKM